MAGTGSTVASLVVAGIAFLGLSLVQQQPARAADALWYELQSGSQVQLADGTGAELTGRVALLCTELPAGAGSARRTFPFYAVKWVGAPEVLDAKVVDLAAGQIPLFGGPGVAVSPGAFMGVQPDGKVRTFQWFLQHRLEHDDGSEALVFRRSLALADGMESRVSFDDQHAGCPSRISLSLVLKDTHATYRPELTTLPLGQQIVSSSGIKDQEEILGQVTLVANAIPGSAEKVRTKTRLLSHADAAEVPEARPEAVKAMRNIKPVRVKEFLPRPGKRLQDGAASEGAAE